MVQNMLQTNIVQYREDSAPAILASQKTPDLDTLINTKANKVTAKSLTRSSTFFLPQLKNLKMPRVQKECPGSQHCKNYTDEEIQEAVAAIRAKPMPICSASERNKNFNKSANLFRVNNSNIYR
jgi:hypothetical protein